jgi:general L-amino acid transport system permease protein
VTPAITSTEPIRPRPGRTWSRAHIRSLVWQLAVVLIVVVVVAGTAVQTAVNLRQRGIASGFEFLGRAAGFEISQGPVPFSSTDSYARALGVGLVNTLRVALVGIVVATVLGLAIGIAGLSGIWIVTMMARSCVELLRNTPLLLQLMFWYSLSQGLPPPREALHPLPGVFLCFRGLYLPSLVWHHGLSIELPAFAGFDFRGGLSISPEFAALLIGLSTYTAVFIGEIVRGGVLAIDRGQTEAAAALGLSRGRVLRLVVLPQALRVIVPPTTSQFLSLTKNSSLAVAIGYPDLISITNTTLNQTGQAIEAITLATLVYLAISLTISLGMNAYDAAATPRVGRRLRVTAS